MGKGKPFSAPEWLPGCPEGFLGGGGGQGAGVLSSWSPGPEMNREETAANLMPVLSGQA